VAVGNLRPRFDRPLHRCNRSLSLESLHKPTYHVLERHSWVGENHTAIFGKLKNLAGNLASTAHCHGCHRVGEGLWAMLDRQFPTRVIPVKFNVQEKSEIGGASSPLSRLARFHDQRTDG